MRLKWGRGLKKSGLNREDYFLETKLGPTLYENDRAVDDTLKRLQVDYIDLMILHHPVNNYIYGYRMLEKAYREGKVRAVGISNFPVDKIQEVLKVCDIKPMVMQAECHPYYPAEQVKPFLDENGIVLQSWFPLGHGNSDMLCDPVFLGLAEKYHKSPAQVILRWHMQMSQGAVPGSRSKEHIKENGDIFDFTLSEDEMEKIALVNKHVPFYQVTPESLQKLAVTKCNFED